MKICFFIIFLLCTISTAFSEPVGTAQEKIKRKSDSEYILESELLPISEPVGTVQEKIKRNLDSEYIPESELLPISEPIGTALIGVLCILVLISIYLYIRKNKVSIFYKKIKSGNIAWPNKIENNLPEKSSDIGSLNELIKLEKRKNNLLNWLQRLSSCIIMYILSFFLIGVAEFFEDVQIIVSVVCGLIGMGIAFVASVFILYKIYSFFVSFLRTDSLPENQKIFFAFSIVSIILLGLALIDRFNSGFYIYLRIIVCASLIFLALKNIPLCLKLPVSLLAILYNPIIQIHLDDRTSWNFFNIITVLALIISWSILLFRINRDKTNNLLKKSK